MSATEINRATVLAVIEGGARDVFALARHFAVLSSSPTLRGVLAELGVTVRADGALSGEAVYTQPTLDAQEGR